MKDKIIKAISVNGQIKITAAYTKGIVQAAHKIHNTSTVATAALGRALTAAAIMGSDLKDVNGSITLQFKGKGPLGSVVAVAEYDGNPRGYVQNPRIELPLKPSGKLDVSGAVGNGYLMVLKDIGVKEPFTGIVTLQSGEIVEDIVKYFAESEQIPTVCALDVLVDTDHSVKQAGGYIIQLLPGANKEVINTLEQAVLSADPVSELLDRGMTMKEIILDLLKEFDIKFLTDDSIQYRCSCSRQRVINAFMSLSKDELKDMEATQPVTQATCQFCDKIYEFSHKDLEKIIKQLKNQTMVKQHEK